MSDSSSSAGSRRSSGSRCPESQKLRAAEAFWREPEGVEQQVEAMALLAQKLKARPRYIQGLPVEKRAQHLAHYPGMPDLLAARMLVSYHLAHQRPMMAAFLDAIGIAHDNGLITEDPRRPISAEQVRGWRAALDRRVSGRRRAALFRDAAGAGSRDVGRAAQHVVQT